MLWIHSMKWHDLYQLTLNPASESNILSFLFFSPTLDWPQRCHKTNQEISTGDWHNSDTPGLFSAQLSARCISAHAQCASHRTKGIWKWHCQKLIQNSPKPPILILIKGRCKDCLCWERGIGTHPLHPSQRRFRVGRTLKPPVFAVLPASSCSPGTENGKWWLAEQT